MRHFIQKFAVSMLTLALVCSMFAWAAPDARALEDPDVQAVSAMLVDVDTGAVLYSKNEDEVRAPASLTKIMTMLLACEAYERGDVSLSDVVTVGPDVYFDVDVDGSTAGLLEGEQLTFEQLLYCAMLASANESCNVIAEHLSGTTAAFVSLMNQRAKELGCSNTNFVNTHGMPDELHRTTARDLMVITTEALKHNLFKRIVATQTYTIPATNMSEERILTSTNQLLSERSPYYYQYATGVKTGSTEAAGFCLVATAMKDGRQLLSVVLGAQSVVLEDGRTQVQSFSESKRLLQWGFDNFSVQELLSTLDLITEVPVELGLGVSSVVLRPAETVKALLPNDVDLNEVELKPTVFSSDPLRAPVESGTVLGEVTVTFQGRDYGKVDLVANSKVELDRAAFVGSEIRSTMSNKYVRLGITVIAILLILYISFIIYYNIRRISKRRVAARLARERIEQYRQAQETSTGKSFEEIEARHRMYETRK